MNNYNIYAIVLDTEIINIIVAENIFVAIECAKTYDSERADAVECGDYKCSIGDYYIEGTFYFKDKETPIPNTSTEHIISTLTESNAELIKSLNEVRTNYNTMQSSVEKLLKNNVNIETALCELAVMIAGDTDENISEEVE